MSNGFKVTGTNHARNKPPVAGAPKSDLAKGLDALVAQPHGGTKTLASFLKEHKTKAAAKEAFTQLSQHLSANKDMKPHVHGKLAKILGDFVKESFKDGEQFDLISDLINAPQTQELGQLALVSLLGDPDQLDKLKKLKDDGKTALFEGVVSKAKSAFGDLASMFCSREPVFDSTTRLPTLNADGTPATKPSGKSLGHDFLLQLNKFVSDSETAFNLAEDNLRGNPHDPALTAERDAKKADFVQSKTVAMNVVSVLFGPAGLSTCLSAKFDANGVLLNRRGADVIKVGEHRAFLLLGTGEDSPMVAHLKLQAEQMSNTADIGIVVANLKDAEGLGCVLDHKGGPIEAFITKALSANGRINYDQIVEVALLSGEHQEAVFSHVRDASSGAHVEAHFEGLRDVIRTELEALDPPNAPDVKKTERLETLLVKVTPAQVSEGDDPVTFDPKTRRKLEVKSSWFSMGQSTTALDIDARWSPGKVKSLSRDLQKVCKEDPVTGHSKAVGGVVAKLVKEHIEDRLDFCEEMKEPGSFTTQQLEDKRKALKLELSLSPSRLRRQSFGSGGPSIDTLLKTGMRDYKEKANTLLESLCLDSLRLIKLQLAMVEAKLQARKDGPQSGDFRGALDREVVTKHSMIGNDVKQKLGSIISGEIAKVRQDIILLSGRISGVKSEVKAQLKMLEKYEIGLRKLRAELASGSGDPLGSIETLRETLNQLDPKKGILFTSTLLSHDHIEKLLAQIEKAVGDQIRENDEGIRGSAPNKTAGGVLDNYVGKKAQIELRVLIHTHRGVIKNLPAAQTPKEVEFRQACIDGLVKLEDLLDQGRVDPLPSIRTFRDELLALDPKLSFPGHKEMKALLSAIKKEVKEVVAENKKKVSGSDAKGALDREIVTDSKKFGLSKTKESVKKYLEDTERRLPVGAKKDMFVALLADLDQGIGNPLKSLDDLIAMYNVHPSADDKKTIEILERIKDAVTQQIVDNQKLKGSDASGALRREIVIERNRFSSNKTQTVDAFIQDKLKSGAATPAIQAKFKKLGIELYHGIGAPLKSLEELMADYAADATTLGLLQQIEAVVKKQIIENGTDPLSASTASQTKHEAAHAYLSGRVIGALGKYDAVDVKSEVKEAITDALENGGVFSAGDITAWVDHIMANAFGENAEGFMMLRPDAFEVIKGAIQVGASAEVSRSVILAMEKILARYSGTGQVDFRQDVMLEQLNKKCHFKDAALTPKNAATFWASIDHLDNRIKMPSSVGSSVAIRMFHNHLVMKGFTGAQTVDEWLADGLSVDARARLAIELNEFMKKLGPRLDKLVVSAENQNDVHILRNLLAKLTPSSRHIATLTALLDACTIDYSQTRPGSSKVGLILTSRLNAAGKVVRLNDIRLRYESLVHLHKQMKGLVALNGNAAVGKFGPQELDDLERELDSLGKALGLRASGKVGIKELNPLDIPDVYDGRTGWDTLDGLMKRLDGLVGPSDGVTKPGLKLMSSLSSAVVPNGVYAAVNQTYQESLEKFSASFERDGKFNFERMPLTAEGVKDFERVFNLKEEIEGLKLQLSGALTSSQADLLATFQRKADELKALVDTLTLIPNVKASQQFVVLNSKFETFMALASASKCHQLQAALHKTMANFCINMLDDVRDVLADPIPTPQKQTKMDALFLAGVLKKDGTFTTTFENRLKSISSASLYDQKGLLRVLKSKIPATPVVVAPPIPQPPDPLATFRTAITQIHANCVKMNVQQFGDNRVSPERHLILHQDLRARGSVFGSSYQASVVDRLVLLKQQQAAFGITDQQLEGAAKASHQQVLFDTANKMATQVIDAWVRAGDATLFQEPEKFTLSFEGYGKEQKAMVQALASSMYQMFAPGGAPLNGVIVELTATGLVISFKPGVPVGERKAELDAMVASQTLLGGVKAKTYAESQVVATEYQGKVQTFAGAFAAANTQVALEGLLKQIVDNNDPQQKQGLMDYLKSGPLTAARVVELRTVITTLARTQATSGIMDGNCFSPDQWQVIFKALTPVDGAGKKDYIAGASNARAVLDSLGSSDAQAAFLKQFLPTKEVDAAFASVQPELDLMACKLLAATMEVPKGYGSLSELLLGQIGTDLKARNMSLYQAIAVRILSDEASLNTLLMGDRTMGAYMVMSDADWNELLPTLDQAQLKTIFNDKWTRAKQVQLATVLDLAHEEVLSDIAERSALLPVLAAAVLLPPPLMAPAPLAPVAALTGAQQALVLRLSAEYKPILDAYGLTAIIPAGGFSSSDAVGIPVDVANFLGLVPGPNAANGAKVYLPNNPPQPLRLVASIADYPDYDDLIPDNADYATRLDIASKLVPNPATPEPQYSMACSLLGATYDSNTHEVVINLNHRVPSNNQLRSAFGTIDGVSRGVMGTALFRGKLWRAEGLSVDGCKTKVAVDDAKAQLVAEGVLQSIAQGISLDWNFNAEYADRYLKKAEVVTISVLEDHPNGNHCDVVFSQEELRKWLDDESTLVGCYWAALCEKLGIAIPDDHFLKPYKDRYDQAKAVFFAPLPPQPPAPPSPSTVRVDSPLGDHWDPDFYDVDQGAGRGDDLLYIEPDYELASEEPPVVAVMADDDVATYAVASQTLPLTDPIRRQEIKDHVWANSGLNDAHRASFENEVWGPSGDVLDLSRESGDPAFDAALFGYQQLTHGELTDLEKQDPQYQLRPEPVAGAPESPYSLATPDFNQAKARLYQESASMKMVSLAGAMFGNNILSTGNTALAPSVRILLDKLVWGSSSELPVLSCNNRLADVIDSVTEPERRAFVALGLTFNSGLLDNRAVPVTLANVDNFLDQLMYQYQLKTHEVLTEAEFGKIGDYPLRAEPGQEVLYDNLGAGDFSLAQAQLIRTTVKGSFDAYVVSLLGKASTGLENHLRERVWTGSNRVVLSCDSALGNLKPAERTTLLADKGFVCRGNKVTADNAAQIFDELLFEYQRLTLEEAKKVLPQAKHDTYELRTRPVSIPTFVPPASPGRDQARVLPTSEFVLSSPNRLLKPSDSIDVTHLGYLLPVVFPGITGLSPQNNLHLYNVLKNFLDANGDKVTQRTNKASFSAMLTSLDVTVLRDKGKPFKEELVRLFIDFHNTYKDQAGSVYFSAYIVDKFVSAPLPENAYEMPVVSQDGIYTEASSPEPQMRARANALPTGTRRPDGMYAVPAQVLGAAAPRPADNARPPLPTAPRPNAVRADLLAPVEVGRRTPAAESKFDSLRRILAKITSSLTPPDPEDIKAMNQLITRGTIRGINEMVKRGLEHARIKALKGESTNTHQMEVVTNLMKALNGDHLTKSEYAISLLEFMQSDLREELIRIDNEITPLAANTENRNRLEELRYTLNEILSGNVYDNREVPE